MCAVQRQKSHFPGLILDSESNDGTEFNNLPYGWQVLRIAKEDFSHGGTRNIGLQHVPANVEVVILMTQDALLASPDALDCLISVFDDKTVACAYGRQLPHFDASPVAAHARVFNYSKDSRTVSIDHQFQLGLKACFLSNSFAAYRVSDLVAVGGFPSDVILGEDMSVAARFLLAGKRIAYVANSSVYHSHNYTIAQEFRRYFDIGVFHARNPWLLQAFGGSGGEGIRYVCSELKYLWKYAPAWIPLAEVRNLFKWLGYKIGCIESLCPLFLKRWLSMNKGFWS